MADIKALFRSQSAVANTIDNRIDIQLYMNKESAAAKTAILSETYATAADHLAVSKALAEEGLVNGPNGIFATYDFVDMTFTMSQGQLDTPGYVDLLDQFKQVCPNKKCLIWASPQILVDHEFVGKEEA